MPEHRSSIPGLPKPNSIHVGRVATLEELNARNRQFWKRRNDRFRRQVAIPGLIEEAMADMAREKCSLASRGVNLSFRQDESLEEAVSKAATKRRFHRRLYRRALISEFSRKGRNARKADLLQQWILSVVKNRPTITGPELLELIRSERGIPPIVEVTEEEILFGDSGAAPISGLKYRLHRAKKASQ